MKELRDCFSAWFELRRLKRRLRAVERQRNIALVSTQHRTRQNQRSRRRSDRKFLENSAKALAARNKRADQAQLNRLEQELNKLKINIKHQQAILDRSALVKWLRLIIGEPER